MMFSGRKFASMRFIERQDLKYNESSSYLSSNKIVGNQSDSRISSKTHAQLRTYQ